MYKFLSGIVNASGNAKAEETKLAARKYAAALRLERVEEDEYREFLRVSPLGVQVREYIQSAQHLAESSPGLLGTPSAAPDLRWRTDAAPAGGDDVTSPSLALSVDVPVSSAAASATTRLLTKGGDTALEEILFNYLRQYPLSSSTVDCLETLLSRPHHFVRAPDTSPQRVGVVAASSKSARSPLATATPLTAQQSINRGTTSGAGRGAHSHDAIPWRLTLLLLHRWYSTLTDAAFLETGSTVFAYFESLFSCWCVLLDRRAVLRERLLSTPLFHTCLKATVALLFEAVTAHYCTRRKVDASSGAASGTPAAVPSASPSSASRATNAAATLIPVLSSDEAARDASCSPQAVPADAFSTLLLCLSVTCLLFGSRIAPFVDPSRPDGGAAVAARLSSAMSTIPTRGGRDESVVDDSANGGAPHSGEGARRVGAAAHAVAEIDLVGELLPLLMPFSKGQYTFRGLAACRQGEQLPTFGMTCLCLILAHAPLDLLEKVETRLTTGLVAADSILLARFSAGGDDVPFLLASITAAERLVASLLRVFPDSLCDAMENAFYFENAANAIRRVPHILATSHRPHAVVIQHQETASVLESLRCQGAQGLTPALFCAQAPRVVRLPCDPDVVMLFDAVHALLVAAHDMQRATREFASPGDARARALLSRLECITGTLFSAFEVPASPQPAETEPLAATATPVPDESRASAASSSSSSPSSLVLCYLLITYAREVLETYPAYYHVLVDLGLYAIVEREAAFADDPTLVVSTASLVLKRLTDSAVMTPSPDGTPRTPDADVNLLLTQISAAMTTLRRFSSSSSRPYSLSTPPPSSQAPHACIESRLGIPLLILELATSPTAGMAAVAQSLVIGADGFARLCELTVVLRALRQASDCPTNGVTTTHTGASGLRDGSLEAAVEHIESSTQSLLLTLTSNHTAQTVLLRDADISPVFLCFSMPRWRAVATDVVRALLQYRDPSLSQAQYEQLLVPLAQLCWDEVRHCEELSDAAPAACSAGAGDAGQYASDGLRKDATLISLLRCFQDALATVGSAGSGEDSITPVRALQEVLYQAAGGECFLRLVHRISLPWSLSSDEGLEQLVRTMTAMVRGNPAMRTRLLETIPAHELVRVLQTEWLEARPGDWCGMVLLVLEMAFEAVLVLPSAANSDAATHVEDQTPPLSLASASVPCASPAISTGGLPVLTPEQLVMRNPALMAALLQAGLAETRATLAHIVASSTATATTSSPQESRAHMARLHGFSVLLKVLVACTESHQINLYLLASVGAFDILVDMLRALVTWHKPAAHMHAESTVTATTSFSPASPEALTTMLMTLLKAMARYHVHVGEVKHLLLRNLVHAPNAAERRRMLPIVTDILCESVTSVLTARRMPAHHLSLTRGAGPAGVRAPLPALHDDGYSVSMWVRLEETMMPVPTVSTVPLTTTAHTSATSASPPSPLQCLFCMQDGQRRVVFALVVDPSTAQLLCVTLDTRGQEVLIPLEGPPLPRHRWVHLVLVRRRPYAASLVNSVAGASDRQREVGATGTSPGGQSSLKAIQLYVDGDEFCAVGRAGYTSISRGAFVLGYAPTSPPLSATSETGGGGGAPVSTTRSAAAMTSFVGQAASVYCFGRVLWEAEVRELYALQDRAYAVTSRSHQIDNNGGGGGAEDAHSLSSRPSPAPQSTTAIGTGTAAAGPVHAKMEGGGTISDQGDAGRSLAGMSSAVFVTYNGLGTETHLAGDALVCMDPRLREHGQLYNLSALVSGRGSREARLQTYPGTIMCSTTNIVDALSVLGAIYTVMIPLLTLLVNPHLPFAPSGVHPVRTDGIDNISTTSDQPADSTLDVTAAGITATAAAPASSPTLVPPPSVSDRRIETAHQLVQLLRELLKVDVILPEFHSSGVFVLTAQVLEELGPLLDAQIVSQLTGLCLATHGVSAALFESAYTSFFLSPDLLRACTRETQVLWTNAHRITVSTCADDVRASMRSLGAQVFCVAELIHFLDDTVGDKEVEAVAAHQSKVEQKTPNEALVVSGTILRDQLFQLLDALTVAPITVADAVAIMHLVTTAAASCSHARVLRDVLAHTRVLIATRAPILAQYLGRADYAVTLIRLVQRQSDSLDVPREALLQLLLLTSRSKRTQEMMNPNYILSPDIVHVAKDVSMAWLKPMLRDWESPSMGTYLVLRCGVVGDFTRLSIPTRHEPLHRSTASIVFPPALEPLLGLAKFAERSALKAYALADLACVLQSDPQGWRRLIAIHGWYIQIINVYLSEYRRPEELLSQAASPLQRQLSGHADGRRGTRAPSWSRDLHNTDVTRSGEGGDDTQGDCSDDEADEARRRHRKTILSCAAAVLAGTLFQALLVENYAAEELLYVVNYLEASDAHALLSRTLLGIAERYLSRLVPVAVTTSGTNTPAASTAAGGSDKDASSGSSTASRVATNLFASLPWANTSSTPSHVHVPAHASNLEGVGLTNLVCFVQTVERVLFCPDAASSSPPNTTVPSVGNLVVMSPDIPAVSTTVKEDADDPRCVPLASLPYQAQIDVLKHPDGRWLHVPLALKVAELISANSSLLHYGTSTTIGSVVSSERLLPLVTGGAGGSGSGGSVSSPTHPQDGGSDASGGSGGTFVGTRAARRLATGGFLRIFGRLVCTVCQLTLSDGNTLDGLFDVLECYVRLVEGDQGGAFSLLRRIISFDDEPRVHSTVATSMQILYALNDLVQRRLRADVQVPAPRYAFPSAEIVRTMQGLFSLFKKSFQQTGLFAKSAPEASCAERYAKVPTLQWLTTRFASITARSQANIVLEAFAEISSRADYNAFMDRCQSVSERARQTAKVVAAGVYRERATFRVGLEAVLHEVYRARTTVRENVETFVTRHAQQALLSDADVADLSSSIGGGEGGAASVTSSFFSLGYASSVLHALRATTWSRFLVHVKGTLWNLDPAGQRHRKYVRLVLHEQLPLLHRKIAFDKDGTDHHDVTLPAHKPAKNLLMGESQLKESRLRLRGGEAVLLQDAALNAEAEAEEAHAEAAEAANHAQVEGADAVLQLPSTHARLRQQAIQDADVDDHETTSSDVEHSATHASAKHDDPRQGLEAAHGTYEGLGTPEGRALSPRHSITSSVSQRSLSARHAHPHRMSNGRQPSHSVTSVVDAAQEGEEDMAAAHAGTPALLSLPCEMPHLMLCWSATFTIRGTAIVVLIDETNTAHNQPVPAEAKPFVTRPHNVSFDVLSIEQLAPGRRFRMRRTALEFWLSDRRSVFVNFCDTEAMRTALSAIFLVAANMNAHRDSVRALAGFYLYSENPKTEPLRLQLMNEWQNRRVTNFDYLMWLNQLAGRSLNDLSQYPIFPWVIADYTSATLDLSNIATFRDLRLPIGACGTEDRRRHVRSRYEEMKEMGDVPSHYFTHYSSPAVALYYLVRLEPFTTLQIFLQGGHLDHADRMFHSIQSCFRSVTTSSQDVRELIPEMFYLPELCLNHNQVSYGVKQDGVSMDNLELPPWAHGDPYVFIYQMRRALESDYVSTYLHHWIDLIFGYKQRGKDAIESLNMFNWHSYEDLDRNRGDSVDQQLLIDSLDNVGQTPIQLFRHPHKARPPRELMDPADSHVAVRPKLVTMRWGCPSVALVLIVANGRVVVVSTNGGVASFRYVAAPVYRATRTFRELPPSPLFSSPLSAAAAHTSAAVTAAKAVSDTLLSMVSGPEQYSFDMAEEHERRLPALPLGVIPDWDDAGRRTAGTPSSTAAVPTATAWPTGGSRPYLQSRAGDTGDAPRSLGGLSGDGGSGCHSPAGADGSGTCGHQNAVVLNYEADSFVAVGGLFDNSVVIRSLSGLRRDVRLMAHSGRVTHLAASRDSRYMVSGAQDTTFIVWRCFVASRRSPQLEVELFFTVHGHEQNPSAVEVSSTMDMLATASSDGVLMLHALSTGNLERTLRHPSGHSIDRILVQSNCFVPNVVLASNTDHVIHQFSLNGAPLRTLTMPGRITSWSLTPNQHLLVGCAVTHRGVPSRVTTSEDAVARDSSNGGPNAPEGGAAPGRHQRGGPSVLYVHSFFLDIRKVVPLAVSGVITSIACHPTDAQVAVAATSEGQLALLRVATPQQHFSL